VPSPHPRVLGGLEGVAALSSDDVWAVGGYLDRQNDIYRTVIEHWDGASWRVVPSPDAGQDDAELHGVAASSKDDVWAVGAHGARTLVEHWNGRSWSIVPSPSPSSKHPIPFEEDNELLGVAVVSASNVWAVGSTSKRSEILAHPLIEHWDGRSWKVVPSPKTDGGLNAVSAIAPNDVWAVGGNLGNPDKDAYRIVIQHWDGREWRLLQGYPTTGNPELKAVDGTASDDVWMVGVRWGGENEWEKALTLHWNGKALSVTAGPRKVVLRGIIAFSRSDAWTVGNVTGSKLQSIDLVRHWNGRGWTIASPTRRWESQLWAVDAVSAHDIWAVGSWATEHYTCR
jgi:hypothetical protein